MSMQDHHAAGVTGPGMKKGSYGRISFIEMLPHLNKVKAKKLHLRRANGKMALFIRLEILCTPLISRLLYSKLKTQ